MSFIYTFKVFNKTTYILLRSSGTISALELLSYGSEKRLSDNFICFSDFAERKLQSSSRANVVGEKYDQL